MGNNVKPIGVTAAEEAMMVRQTETHIGTKAAAKRLGVSRVTLSRWVRLGYFPGAFPINPMSASSAYLIPLSAIEDFEKRRHMKAISENGD